VIEEIDARYERERRKGTVRDPQRLARTMVRNAGLSALRANTVQHKGHRRPILEVPIERQDPATGRTHSLVDEQARHQPQPPDQALDELRARLRREDEQADHRSKLEQMRRRLGDRLLGVSEVICPLHERGCPQAAKVLASAHQLVTSLGNALDEQEAGTWEQAGPHGGTPWTGTQPEWDQRLHQRLLRLASEAAHAIDPAMYDNTPGGRQARARVARCVLHPVWWEARTAEFKYLAEQTRVTIEWLYAQQLRRQDLSIAARRRLLAWLKEHEAPPFDTEGDQ